jgi:hypothetical protein
MDYATECWIVTLAMCSLYGTWAYLGFSEIIKFRNQNTLA